LALAAGVAAANAPARADDGAFEKDRWFAACDGVSACTAWAMGGAGAGRDCGEALRWAWEGAAFRLVERAELSGDYCQGVTEKDWPVLYRARIVDR